MATLPTEDIQWATGGGAEISAPSTGQKQQGHQAGYATPSKWQNWWQKAVYTWTQWLSARRTELVGVVGSNLLDVWSTAAGADTAATYRSVCYAPSLGIFVAVANAGTNRVMTSVDGVSWSAASAAEANSWTSVCWSPSLALFVAVSADGTHRVMTSPDGTTWTVRTAASAATWSAVCWSPELSKFVAVANTVSTAVQTSSDGITWASQTGSEANSWSWVCWSPALSLFVAVATDGTHRVQTSPDGVTWTARTAAEANSWNSVCWSPELALFCAVSSDGTHRAMTSTDGTTWTARTIGSDAYTGICWSPEVLHFAAVAGGKILTSTDGITWKVRRSSFGASGGTLSNYIGIGVSDKGRFVAVGGETTTQHGVVVNAPTMARSVKGTTTNDSAYAGEAGEYVVGQAIASAAVSMGGTSVVTQIASITLSAGDWDISAAGSLTLNGATLSGTQARLAINTSVALPSTDTQPWQYQIIPSPTASLDVPAVFPPFRASISGSTTYSLLGDIGYSAGTPKGYGQIRARRVR